MPKAEDAPKGYKEEEPDQPEPAPEPDKPSDDPDPSGGDTPDPSTDPDEPAGGGGGGKSRKPKEDPRRQEEPKSGDSDDKKKKLPVDPPIDLPKDDPLFPVAWSLWRIFRNDGEVKYKTKVPVEGKPKPVYKEIPVKKPGTGKGGFGLDELLVSVFGPHYKPKTKEEQYLTGGSEFADLIYEQCTEAAAESAYNKKMNRLPLTWPIAPCRPVVTISEGNHHNLQGSINIDFEKCSDPTCCAKPEPWAEVTKHDKHGPTKPKPTKNTGPKKTK